MYKLIFFSFCGTAFFAMNRVCAGYFQDKAILFFGLCLFLNHSALAELSHSQKREFVEQLAQPFSEKKVFYSWVPETSWETLIEAGEWTPELYEHYMYISRDHSVGSGFYVSEHINEGYTPDSGKALMQIEVGPDDLGDSDYRYLNPFQREIRKALRERNIGIQELLNFRFNSQIAIKYSLTKDRWVLKGRKGVRFKPFSSEDMSLDILEQNYRKLHHNRQVFFRTAIRADILNRQQRGDPAILSSPFIEIIKEAHGGNYVSAALYDVINSPDFRIETMRDAIRWLENAGSYLSVQDKRKLAKAATGLPIDNLEETMVFLTLAQQYLSSAEIMRIVSRTPAKTSFEKRLLGAWLPSPRSCHNNWVVSPGI